MKTFSILMRIMISISSVSPSLSFGLSCKYIDPGDSTLDSLFDHRRVSRRTIRGSCSVNIVFSFGKYCIILFGLWSVIKTFLFVLRCIKRRRRSSWNFTDSWSWFWVVSIFAHQKHYINVVQPFETIFFSLIEVKFDMFVVVRRSGERVSSGL